MSWDVQYMAKLICIIFYGVISRYVWYCGSCIEVGIVSRHPWPSHFSRVGKWVSMYRVEASFYMSALLSSANELLDYVFKTCKIFLADCPCLLYISIFKILIRFIDVAINQAQMNDTTVQLLYVVHTGVLWPKQVTYMILNGRASGQGRSVGDCTHAENKAQDKCPTK